MAQAVSILIMMKEDEALENKLNEMFAKLDFQPKYVRKFASFIFLSSDFI
jgi:hypothetical protein